MISYLSIILTLFLLIMPISSQATVFQWTDEQGNVGFTDDPDKIPEKYRSDATRMDGTKVPKKPKPDVSQTMPPAINPTMPPPAVDNEGRDENWWRTRVQDLRNRKKYLLDEKSRLTGSTDSLGKLGLGNVEANQQAKETENRLQEIDNEIRSIDNDLTVVLPEEARKANAPPGWLRE